MLGQKVSNDMKIMKEKFGDGTAPKYAGLDKVNPIAMILSAKMMLDWLGEKEKGARLEKAVAEVIKEGKVRTYDMKGSNTTTEMAKAIADKI